MSDPDPIIRGWEEFEFGSYKATLTTEQFIIVPDFSKFDTQYQFRCSKVKGRGSGSCPTDRPNQRWNS